MFSRTHRLDWAYLSLIHKKERPLTSALTQRDDPGGQEQSEGNHENAEERWQGKHSRDYQQDPSAVLSLTKELTRPKT
jgi:hypothetical protein